MIKTLYIITQADGGGAQKYVLTLAQHFHGEIAAGEESSELFDQAGRLGINTYRLKHLRRNIHPWHDILALFEIAAVIKKARPDIIHLNSSKAGFLGSIVGKLLSKKIIFTAHGMFYFKRTAWPIKMAYTALEKFASLFRNIIIAVSEEDATLANHYKLLPKQKIITIYNGINPIDFFSKEQARATLGINGQKIIIGNVAQYYHRKGLDSLIEAVALLPNDILEKIQLVMIGEGPERQRLTNLIASKHLQNLTILTGFKEQAARLLKAFDIFVLPSRQEGFPYVLLEAMQAGLPVIVTDVGGNKEALGGAGLLIPANNSKALADAIQNLLTDDMLKQGLSQKALERSKLFTEEKMLEETKKIYTKVL